MRKIAFTLLGLGALFGIISVVSATVSQTVQVQNDVATFGQLQATATSTLATTTASMINGTIVVDGVKYPKTGCGVKSAVADAPSGATVFVPRGTYEFAAGCAFHFGGKSIRLIGAGATSTVFIPASGFSSFGIIYDFVTPTTNPNVRKSIEIAGITFDGNSNASTSAIQMGSATDLYIHDNVFTNVVGIWTVIIGNIGGTLGTETDAEIDSSATNNLVFENNIVSSSTNSTYESVLCVNCKNSKFVHNTFRGLTQAAATLSIFGYGRNNLIANNTWYDNTQEIIYVQESDRITIADNTVDFRESSASLGSSFVRIINSQDIKIENNIIRGYSDGSSGSGSIAGYDNIGGFDGHRSRHPSSADITIRNNEWSGHYSGVTIPSQFDSSKRVTQKDILIEGNRFGHGIYAAVSIGHATTTGMERIIIRNNIASTTELFGNAGTFMVVGSTTNPALLRNVEISGNTAATSTAGSTSAGIYVAGAKNVRIFNNNTVGTGKGGFHDIEVATSTENVVQSSFTNTDYTVMSAIFGNATSTITGKLNLGTLAIGTSTPGGLAAIENTGTTPGLMVSDQANDTSPFVIDASGNVGVGTKSTSGAIITTGSTGNQISFQDGSFHFSQTNGSAFFRSGFTVKTFGLANTSSVNQAQWELDNGNQWIRGKLGVGTTTLPAALTVDSGSTATTTVNIGDISVIGTKDSPGCIQISGANGQWYRLFINITSGAAVTEQGTC